MSRHRNKFNFVKILKDYTVPLIGLFLIIILIFNIFSDDKDIEQINNTKADIEANSWVKISLLWENTKAYIVYKTWKKVELTDIVSFWKWEKLIVEEWKVNVVFPLLSKITLWKSWELQYKDDWSLFLESWNAWIEAMDNLNISMKYASVDLKSGAIASFIQNAIESVVYNIDWGIKVSSLYWLETDLWSNKKIVIKARDTNSSELNLKNTISEMDSNFQTSSWFINNWWNLIITKNKHIENTGSINKNSWDFTKLIEFDNLQDESFSKESNINISWRYDPLKIWKITINNQDVKLNLELGTFAYKTSLKNKINDLIIKMYDKDNIIISKKVFTVYTNKSWNSNIYQNAQNSIENFQIDPSQFIIYEPTKTGKITTTSSQITIRWKVLNSKVKSVLVNDYKLKSFNWKTWRYHAFVNQNTLRNWTNLYTIQYFWENNKLLFKEYYNIYKKITKKSIKKISNEVKIKN